MYQLLFNTTFRDTFPTAMIGFEQAYNLYDYVQYHYTHNATVRAALNTTKYIELLFEYASLQQWNLNGNLSAWGRTPGDMIRAVSGRTLAERILFYMSSRLSPTQDDNKLTLMFGSFEPFIAFFALAGLTSEKFMLLPRPGAAMVFELFSPANSSSTAATPTFSQNLDNLWVRFLYRNSTDPAAPFQEHPLFGRAADQFRMPFREFQTAMKRISIGGFAGWCNACESVNLFCSALSQNGGSSSSGGRGWGRGSGAGSRISPPVAGVIGALVALALIAIAAALAFFFGKLRVYRRDGASDPRRSSSLGGFKGAEKMASDTDLAITRSGVRHERTGSWELRGGAPPAAGDGGPAGAENLDGAGIKTKDWAAESSKQIDDDALSISGAKPVRPRDVV